MTRPTALLLLSAALIAGPSTAEARRAGPQGPTVQFDLDCALAPNTCRGNGRPLDQRIAAGTGQRISRFIPVREELRFVLASVGTGRSVWVTDAHGVEHAGMVRHVDKDWIEFATSTGPAFMNLSDIRRIERIDSIGDGVRRGALIGAASLGGLFGVLVAGCGSDCIRVDGAIIWGGSWGAGFGALFGAIADGFNRHRETVFDRTPGTASMQLAPLVGAAGTGVSLRATW